MNIILIVPFFSSFPLSYRLMVKILLYARREQDDGDEDAVKGGEARFGRNAYIQLPNYYKKFVFCRSKHLLMRCVTVNHKPDLLNFDRN